MNGYPQQQPLNDQLLPPLNNQSFGGGNTRPKSPQ